MLQIPGIWPTERHARIETVAASKHPFSPAQAQDPGAAEIVVEALKRS